MTIEVSREKFKSTVAAGLARANNEFTDFEQDDRQRILEKAPQLRGFDF